jgi:2-(1,2-epoxy-1,2-dihydrophenyl)acetyl-CoA isomerase
MSILYCMTADSSSVNVPPDDHEAPDGEQVSYVRRIGRVLECVIATKDKGSSLDGQAVRQATAALGELALDHSAGCILLTSDGPNFCTGGDVRAFGAATDRRAYVGAVAREFHKLIRAIASTQVPVVAAVNGWAAGAGMSLVCVSDIAIGGPSTRLRPAYPSIGFSPDGGMSWTLPRIVGMARARDILLTDRVLSGDEAVTAGLLSRLVPDEQIAAEARATAEALGNGPTSTYGHIKRLLATSSHSHLNAHLAAEAESIAACADSPSGRSGVEAFLARRR